MMRKSLSQPDGRCPNFEELSAGRDQVEPEFGCWSDHRHACPACREILEELQTVDDAVKDYVLLQSASPERITADIKREFYRKIELAQSRNSHLRIRLTLQLAAALTICCAVIFWALRGAVTSPTPDKPETASTPIDLNDFPYYSDIGTTTADSPPGLSGENAVSLRDFIPASYGSEPIFVDRVFSQAARTPIPADIAGVVDHVWIVRKSADTVETLSRLAAEMGGPQKLVIEHGNGRILLTGEISKLNLARLVKLLAQSGFELISPQSPQPEERVFRGAASTPVSYSARFLTVESP